MEILHACCAGLDLGKDTLVASVRKHTAQGAQRECRTYETTTRQLLELSQWLTNCGVTHVVMEATGVYWKSVWRMLEGQFELVLANATQVKQLKGRKSDVKDAEWLSDLLAHGLVRGSFVAPAPIQELRELMRTRKQLVREIARHTQRIQKVLDSANLKITGVVADILGVSGRAMVRALIQGETRPEVLADLARGTLRIKRSALIEALNGRVTAHHRYMLDLHLNLVETLEQSLATLDAQVEQVHQPFRPHVDRLDTVPGLGPVSARALLAEIGTDMSRFPSHRHLVSWACLCPRLDQSAGRVRSNRTLKGANWLKPLLVQAAWAAVKVKDSYLRTQYFRLRARRGARKAIVAVAASILTAVYYILRDGVPYRDLGSSYFDQHDHRRATQRLVRRLRGLGYDVQIKGMAA